VARSVAGGASLWQETAVTLAPAAPDVTADRADPGEVVAELLEAMTRDELSAGEAGSIADRIASVRPVFESLADALPALDRPEAARARRRLADRLRASGVHPDAADRVAALPEMVVVPHVAALAAAAPCPPLVAAGAFLEVGDQLGVDRLLRCIARADDGDQWAAEARGGLADDLMALRRDGAAAALASGVADGLASPEDGQRLAQQWLATRAERLAEAVAIRRRVEDDAQAGIDAVVVAVRALRRVVS
jgi:NAD-specific glutamate dehydrogenase